MINTPFLYGAIAIMLIVIISDFLKRKYNVDLDNFDYQKVKAWFFECLEKGKFGPMINNLSISKKIVAPTNDNKGKSLVLVDAGSNKATVMATLRQITGIDYMAAKNIVESVPAKFMDNVSEKQADLTKKALEFVGAKVEIK